MAYGVSSRQAPKRQNVTAISLSVSFSDIPVAALRGSEFIGLP
ncbi:MAG: hypothetical protein R3281_08230 [Balneolaceae bacterium]|nr:hypothetical protein [Balneolaceae bacterium]